MIVEDDAGLQSQYKWGFDAGFDIVFASDRKEAVKATEEHQPAVVLLDLGLPPDPDNATEGLLYLSELMSLLPSTKVIVLTGSEQREHARRAIELGAWEFQQKGIELDELQCIIERAFNLHAIDAENKALQEAQYGSSSLIGNSPAMTSAMMILSRIAPMPVTTLVLGESGTGKELFAQNLHHLSQRKGEFVAINCASIPPELLESELFGHEKGAFTGAHKAKIGKIERANGGTLFLDEIGDMPLDLQSKMLRFLQEREIERVGGNGGIKVDVRVVCATHRDLKNMTGENTFRLDLYYRLAEFTLNVPALREREGDVILLANFLINKYNEELGTRIKGLSDDAINALVHHSFPGNIRELQNRIKGGIIVCDGELLNASMLGLENQNAMLKVPPSFFETNTDELSTLDEIRRSTESRAIFNAYRRCDQNISHAAKMLGITRPTFYSLIEKYDMRLEKESD